MTPFEEAVLAVLRSLHRGEVVSYGDVAEEAGFPRAARAVGNLLRACAEDVPWWRVVAADGRLVSPDPALQARLLAEEGVRAVAGRLVRAAPGHGRQREAPVIPATTPRPM